MRTRDTKVTESSLCTQRISSLMPHSLSVSNSHRNSSLSTSPIATMTKLLLFLLLLLDLFFSLVSSMKTDPSDVAALRSFKSSISPSTISPWSCLFSWNFSSDPCHPQLPIHFTCGLSCTPTSPSTSRVVAVALDPAGYSGILSPSISALSLLSHLSLFDNFFRGAIPPSISSLSSLHTLVLSSNSFSGTIPSSVSLLSNLETLDLSRNGLTGLVPGLPPSLASLDLSFNSLSGSLPNLFPPNLVELSLRGNLLSGSLKRSTFQSLQYLEVLELAANRIEGKVEGWLFLLPSLQQLDLANNSISSVQVWKPTGDGRGGGGGLVAVDLSFNKIRGELPADFGVFPSMAALSARHNRFRGQIPWQYKKMKRLFLDGNFLNGQVPDELLKGEAFAGSLGDNCLETCPKSFPLCSPVQKPDWVCKQIYGVSGGRRRLSTPAVN